MSIKTEVKRQRGSLLRQVEKTLEGPMVFLGFVWLALLVVELTRGLTPVLEMFSIGIWVVFIIDFLIKLIIAPDKGIFFKRHWLTVISLIIPALRVVRVFRVVRLLRGLRSIRLVKILASLNRGMRSLGKTMSRRGVAYVLLLTIGVLLAGAAGMLAFEREEGGLTSYGHALWWTAMILITMGTEYWPLTPEGRALSFLLALYGFSIFGYITATLASFFVGRDAEEQSAPVAGSRDIRHLSQQVEALTKTVGELKASLEESAASKKQP
ncbi:MAG TPA: ion transporter [Chitinophagaceae bacterium]